MHYGSASVAQKSSKSSKIIPNTTAGVPTAPRSLPTVTKSSKIIENQILYDIQKDYSRTDTVWPILWWLKVFLVPGILSGPNSYIGLIADTVLLCVS